MEYDLRNDAVKLRQYIRDRVRSFDAMSNDTPGSNSDPITLIHVGFENEQGGYVAIVFDTRPTATPDGEWTMHIEDGNNWIEFPAWAECTESIFEDSQLKIVAHDGTELVFTPKSDEGFFDVFGNMIAAEIERAISDGVFSDLPRTASCRIYIEEINGNFAWPDSEELPIV